MTSVKILINILDDAEADREFIERALGKNDQLQITSFFDPNLFRESLSDDVSLIITDVLVPGFDIFEMVQYIHDHYPGIYIIVISGHFNDDIYDKLFELGVDRVVKKTTGAEWVNKVWTYVNQLLPKILLKKELIK